MLNSILQHQINSLKSTCTSMFVENALKKIFMEAGKSRSVEILCKKVTPIFRAYEFPKTLKFFLWQCILDKIFRNSLCEAWDSHSVRSDYKSRALSSIEKNAIRYAVGYIVRKLHKKYGASSTSTSQTFTSCLEGLICDTTDLQDGSSDELI